MNWYGGFLSEESWTVIMILIATVIYALLINYRNMREAALVGVWAFIAIAVRQWNMNESIVYTAIVAALILFIYAGYHGYKNKSSSPFEKLKRGEV